MKIVKIIVAIQMLTVCPMFVFTQNYYAPFYNEAYLSFSEKLETENYSVFSERANNKTSIFALFVKSETENYAAFAEQTESKTGIFTPFEKSETENYSVFGEQADNKTGIFTPFVKSVEALGLDICPMCGAPLSSFVDNICPICGYEIGNGNALSGVPAGNETHLLSAMLLIYGLCLLLKRKIKRNKYIC